ncbi:MAG: T9SS type A sorting domain-containing protein [bacterium]
MNELKKENLVSIYSTSNSHMNICLSENANADIFVYNMQGQLIQTNWRQSGHVDLDIRHLDRGMYILKILYGHHFEIKNFEIR